MMKELGSNSNDVEDALDVIYKRIDRVSDTIYFVGWMEKVYEIKIEEWVV